MAHRHDVFKRGGKVKTDDAQEREIASAAGLKRGGKAGDKVHGKKGRSKFARGGAIGSGPAHGPIWSSAHGKK